jgi:8-oxo-dGTP pyrophosphatase MutT (NUDIX family)
MSHAFDDTTRRNIAARCAAFTRMSPAEAGPGLKRAAVALALTAIEGGKETALLLTRRAAGLRAHRAQWALPGGRCDAGETQPEAARRELREELGLDLAAGAVLGLLDDYPTRSGYLITPVVMWVDGCQPISPSPAEVESVHTIPLALIERADAFDFTVIPESTRRVIRFHFDQRLIHAPTAAMIYQFREVLAGRETRVADLEQPVFAWK